MSPFPSQRHAPSRRRRAAVFAAPRGAISKGIFSSLKRISPLEPQDRGGLSTVAAKRFPRSFGRANRAAASKAPRFFRHWRRFGAFPLDPRTPMLVSEFPYRYVSVFLLTIRLTSLSAAAPSVRLCSPLLRLSQPVCIWYENSHEFCPKPHRRAAAAARSRSNRKPHLAWQAAPCTAHAASSPQGQTMACQGRSPCVLLGSRRGGSLSQREPPLRKAARRAAKQRQPLRKTPPSAQNFQKILPLLHKSGRQTPPCAPFSEALRKKRSRKGEPCRKTKRAPPRAAHP